MIKPDLLGFQIQHQTQALLAAGRFFGKFHLMLGKQEDFSSVGQELDKLKTAYIAKAIPVVVACSILAIFLVPNGFAYKFGDIEPAQAKSCNNKPSSFTIFPYASLKTNSNGSATGVEVHLSSADGDCSEMIYSSYDVGYTNNSGTIRDSKGMAISLR